MNPLTSVELLNRVYLEYGIGIAALVLLIFLLGFICWRMMKNSDKERENYRTEMEKSREHDNKHHEKMDEGLVEVASSLTGIAVKLGQLEIEVRNLKDKRY